MHVALVIYGDLEQTSGGFRYDRQLVSFLRGQGDSVTVISLPWRRYPGAVLGGFSRAIRAQLDRPVDILLEDGLCHPSLWWHNSRLHRPTAVVSLLHHLRSDDPTERFRALLRPIERRYLESVDATIATSEFTRQRATAIAPSVASQPTTVAPPSGRAEGAALSPNAVSERAHRGPLRITFVGNVVPRKDPRTLLEAFARGCRAGADWELTLVGSHEANPSYAGSVLEDVQSLDLGERVTVTGPLETDALERVLETSHVCCAPSRYEAFGMVSLEAMEYGVVPIASTRGGPREFIDHGRTGFLVEPGDVEGIASVFERVDRDRELLATLGQNALETAAEHPTWAETMTKIRSFLLALDAK